VRLFLKHILRSIKKAPLQPLIIIFTLTIAVATLLTTVKMSISTIKETEYKKGRIDTSSDITVKLSNSDEVRILFKDEAERIIGDGGSVIGEFSLTALTTDKDDEKFPVTIMATELERAESFYSIALTENTKINEKEINDCAILSDETARELGLGVGDTFAVDLLGLCFDFKVAAIAKSESVFYENGALINIGAVTEAIAEKNPFIAALADSITPFTQLKIKLNDSAMTDSYIELLKSDEAFASKTVIKNSENLRSEDFVSTLALIAILVCAVIVALICALVITTSLDLLSKERMADMALFMISGADTGTLNRILYLECLLYSLISAGLGLLLSIPFSLGINEIFDFRTGDLAFSMADIPIVLIASPLAVITVAFVNSKKEGKLTVSERLTKTGERRTKAHSCKLFLTFLSLSAIFLIVALLVPVKIRFPFGTLSALLLVGFVFTFTPYLAEILSRGASALLNKKRNPPPLLLTSVHNMTASYPIKHTARLITILLTLLSTAFFCINALTGELEHIENLVDSEYIVLGADERSDEIAAECEGVNACYRIFVTQDASNEENSGFMSISVSEGSLNCINKKFRPQRLPVNNEVVLSSGLALMNEKKIGDEITLKYQGNSYVFKVIDIVPTGANLTFIDSKYIGEENDFLCIDADFDENSDAFVAISEIMNLRGAYLANRNEIFSPMLKGILSFANMAKYVFYIALFTTLIGIVNVLFSDYITRKREKEVYYTVGMTKKQMLAVRIYEILSTVTIAALLAPIFTLALSFLIDFSLISFGVDLIAI